ncbi:trimeric intracellular cation channel family protein [Stackebrandtia soli]|uniref:trimeric intracellular cation channel family protein n=1 Tax=Stackebrandtia soli TaxID=1892856 RepID=UPI0039EAC40F
MLLLVLSLLGTAVFAASGAAAAAARRLDLFGVVVVGFITALGGGMIRDVVIGVSPPVAFVDWRYSVTAILTSSALFWTHARVFRLRRTMLTLDAAGLGLFTVVGTAAAIDAGLPVIGACMVGMITGVGGGVIRDVLTNEVPVVLHREIYAVASAVGALIVATGSVFDWPEGVMSVIGAVVVFGLRMVSVQRNWSAPLPKLPPESA